MNESLYAAIGLGTGLLIGGAIARDRLTATIANALEQERNRLAAFQPTGPAPRLDRCAWFERKGKLHGLAVALAIVRRIK
jgi:hypothetical protein